MALIGAFIINKVGNQTQVTAMPMPGVLTIVSSFSSIPPSTSLEAVFMLILISAYGRDTRENGKRKRKKKICHSKLAATKVRNKSPNPVGSFP